MFANELGAECLHILLVEDSRREAMLTQRQLCGIDDDFSIQSVPTLKEAVARIDGHKIDAVVLDLGLPDASGTHSILTLSKHFPDLPIVVLSGQSDAVAGARALQHGAQEFLLKGECSSKMIRQAILSAIFRKTMMGQDQPAH